MEGVSVLGLGFQAQQKHSVPIHLTAASCICAVVTIAYNTKVDGGREGRQHLARGRAHLAQGRAPLDWRMSVDTWPEAVPTGRTQIMINFFPSCLGAPRPHPRLARILIPDPDQTLTACASEVTQMQTAQPQGAPETTLRCLPGHAGKRRSLDQAVPPPSGRGNLATRALRVQEATSPARRACGSTIFDEASCRVQLLWF